LPVSTMFSEDLERKALRLHGEALVVDTHCDTVQSFFPERKPSTPYREGAGLGNRSNKGHVDIPRLVDGGVDCQVFAVYAAYEPNPPRPLRSVLKQIDVLQSEFEKNRDRIMLTRGYEEILEAGKHGKVAALLSLEGGEAIEGDLGVLRMLYRLGVRMMSLTWNYRNELADGVGEDRAKAGLTNLGVNVVKEMERLGMVVDVSHLSDSSFWDLVKSVSGPVIASHSNSRVLCNHPRNLTDEQIEAVAKTGGVVGVNFSPSFISRDEPTVDKVVDHIDHIVELVGVEHAGLGSDFDGISSTPKGLEDVTCMPNITKTLVSRGYTDTDIRKVLGENHLRVFKKVLH